MTFDGRKPHPLEESDHDPVTTKQLHRKNWGAEHSGDAEEEYDGQGRRRQQQKPERRKVPATQHS